MVSLDGMPAEVFKNAWEYHGSDIHVQELWTVYPSITVPAQQRLLNQSYVKFQAEDLEEIYRKLY